MAAPNGLDVRLLVFRISSLTRSGAGCSHECKLVSRDNTHNKIKLVEGHGEDPAGTQSGRRRRPMAPALATAAASSGPEMSGPSGACTMP